MVWVRDRWGPGRVSERRACRVLGQARSTQRRVREAPDEEAKLVIREVELASEYGRYGYRRVTAMLRGEGWIVNHKRVERLWRQEGLKVPSRQPERKRFWLTDGSCVRIRPTHRNHVWSYDFLHDRIKDGRTFQPLTILDEYTGMPGDECGRGDELPERDGQPGRVVYRAWGAGVSSVRQRLGVYGSGDPGLAQGYKGEEPQHRAGQSLGKWIREEF